MCYHIRFPLPSIALYPASLDAAKQRSEDFAFGGVGFRPSKQAFVRWKYTATVCDIIMRPRHSSLRAAGKLESGRDYNRRSCHYFKYYRPKRLRMVYLQVSHIRSL